MRVMVVDSEPAVSAGGSFARGFRALGHDVRFFDQTPYLGGYLTRLPLERYWRPVARGPLVVALNVALLAEVLAFKPDVLLVMKGGQVLPETLRSCRKGAARLAVFASDDYLNPLNVTRAMQDSLPEWDAVFTPRSFAVDELRAAGARAACFLPFGWDEALHGPSSRDGALAADVRDAVTFVGTWAPERPPLFEPLAAAGLAVRIYGDGWSRLPAGSKLGAAVRHKAIYAADMCEVVTHAGINVALLRKGNRDRQTMRTYEIPACEGFMLAERSEEHRALFEEGVEAAFFGSEAEFVSLVERWLPDAPGRRRVAEAGRRRLLADRHTYRDRARTLLATLGAS